LAPDRRFEFQKRGQLLIRSHNETLSVVAMRVSDPDRSPLARSTDATQPTPSGLTDIVADDFPAPLHARDSAFSYSTWQSENGNTPSG